jgi:hypothetical protein
MLNDWCLNQELEFMGVGVMGVGVHGCWREVGMHWVGICECLNVGV